MGLSMKKSNGRKKLIPYFITITVAIVLAFAVVAFLPLEFAVKKLLFFILINVFAIGLVFVMNKARRK